MFSIHTHTKKALKKRHSLRTTLFWQAFFLLALCTIGTAMIAFVLAQREFTMGTTAKLRASVQTQGNLFEESIARQREQLAIIGRDAELEGISSVTKLVGFSAMAIVDESNGTTMLHGDPSTVGLIEKTVAENLSKDFATQFIPIFDDRGWQSYLIAAPRYIDAEPRGTIVAIFDASPILTHILRVHDQHTTSEILLVQRNKNDTIVLHRDADTGEAVRIYEQHRPAKNNLIADALTGAEGVLRSQDYAGINVLAAYRSLPSVAWTIIMKVDAYEVSSPIVRLALQLVIVSSVLVILLSLSMYFLAERIVEPLEHLVRKFDGLEAKHWKYARSIFTQNELEDVDEAATDLTHRLQLAHEHLEAIIREKSASLKKELAENTTILESMDYGLMVTDEDGAVSYMNRSGSEITGWSQEESLGKDARELCAITEREHLLMEKDHHPVSIVLQSHKHFVPSADAEFSLVRKDGSESPLHLRATPILVGATCLGVVIVFRDVTEERQIDHMKSEFISLVSHQLRTPLSSMRWYLEMLLAEDAGPLTADQHEYVQEVAGSNARMVHLVNALLNVSRLEMGAMQVVEETIDPKKMIEEIVATFSIDVQRKKISLKNFFELPQGFSFQSDRSLVQLIIENLMSNAMKYAMEGTEIRLSLTQPTKAALIFTIENIGVEIPEEQKASIGKRLFRATSARLANTDGNGLGLYISHIAAEAIGAHITFESTKGSTTFMLTIPVDHAKKKQASTPSEA